VRYLLDTNVISDARVGRSPQVADWIARQRIADLAISSITVLELELGVRRKERQDERSGRALRKWLDEAVLPLFDGRVLAVDERVARAAGGLHVPDPMPAMDAIIAATAIVHGLILVTRNRKDMERTGVAVLDPWVDA